MDKFERWQQQVKRDAKEAKWEADIEEAILNKKEEEQCRKSQ